MSSPFDQAAQSSASAAPTPADSGAPGDADESTQAQPGTYKAIIHVGNDGAVHVMVTKSNQVLCDEDVKSLDEAMEEVTECISGAEQSEQPGDEEAEANDTGAEDQGEGDQGAIPDMSTMWQQEAKKRQGSTRSVVAPGSQV